MKTYRVDDLSRGLLADIPKVEANSPKEAAEKIVGAKVERDYTGHDGDIVVRGCGKSFVYKRITD